MPRGGEAPLGRQRSWDDPNSTALRSVSAGSAASVAEPGPGMSFTIWLQSLPNSRRNCVRSGPLPRQDNEVIRAIVMEDSSCQQSEVIRAIMMEDSPCQQSEVIRAIVMEDSPCQEYEVIRAIMMEDSPCQQPEVIRAIMMEDSPCLGHGRLPAGQDADAGQLGLLDLLVAGPQQRGPPDGRLPVLVVRAGLEIQKVRW